MSIYCECVECGGTNEFLMCEHSLMDAWTEAYRPQHLLHGFNSLMDSWNEVPAYRRILAELFVFLSFFSLG